MQNKPLLDSKDKTIAALRAQLKRVEEERDRAMRAADGARERATRWQETAECEADGLEHWKSACESSKAALAAKEKELEELRKAEKLVSDAYLRIRELVGSWRTKPGGTDRFELTEQIIKDLQARLVLYEKAVEGHDERI